MGHNRWDLMEAAWPKKRFGRNRHLRRHGGKSGLDWRVLSKLPLRGHPFALWQWLQDVPQTLLARMDVAKICCFRLFAGVLHNLFPVGALFPPRHHMHRQTLQPAWADIVGIVDHTICCGEHMHWCRNAHQWRAPQILVLRIVECIGSGVRGNRDTDSCLPKPSHICSVGQRRADQFRQQAWHVDCDVRRSCQRSHYHGRGSLAWEKSFGFHERERLEIRHCL
mmetsp:Transcript_48430/g.123260  ORF Transcript_48430/g.123260 Transcript_48430/m.123260 type:complete len:223 (-) Transcript_48430:875-1543(-)